MEGFRSNKTLANQGEAPWFEGFFKDSVDGDDDDDNNDDDNNDDEMIGF